MSKDLKTIELAQAIVDGKEGAVEAFDLHTGIDSSLTKDRHLKRQLTGWLGTQTNIYLAAFVLAIGMELSHTIRLTIFAFLCMAGIMFIICMIMIMTEE